MEQLCEILREEESGLRMCKDPAEGMDSEGTLVCRHCGPIRMKTVSTTIEWFDERWKRKAPRLQALITEDFTWFKQVRPERWREFCSEPGLKLIRVVSVHEFLTTEPTITLKSIDDDTLEIHTKS